jgi:hypothetical protein
LVLPAFGFPALLAVAMLSGVAVAQSTALRDPTEPPLAYSSKPGTVRNPIDGFKPEHLVAVDGQRYLVWKGRRYGVGDSLHGARIERLDETEVWLRNDAGLRKLSLFAGVEKKSPDAGVEKSSPPAGAPTSTVPKTSVPPGAAKGRTQ